MSKHPGKIRWKLADLLAEKGLIVSPYDLHTQEGGYRYHTWDLCRWYTCDARWKDGRTPDGDLWTMPVHLSSWSTMTNCVKHGIEVAKDGVTWGDVSVEHIGGTNK